MVGHVFPHTRVTGGPGAAFQMDKSVGQASHAGGHETTDGGAT